MIQSKKSALISVFSLFFILSQTSQANYKQLSLEELKQLCHSSEDNEQIFPFTSSITCQADRTFWAPSGEKRFTLENHGTISVEGLIKDGAFSSKSMALSWAPEPQEGTCMVYQKWLETARTTEKIESCEQLDTIVNEQEYCKVVLENVWQECDSERAAATQQQSPFQVPVEGRCEYTPLEKEASCSGQAPTHPLPEQDKPSCPAREGSSSSSDSSSSSSSSHGEEKASCYELGAEVSVTMVDRGFLHHSHKVIHVSTPVMSGSMLDKIGLNEGDVISRINSDRVRTIPDFYTKIARAKDKGKIRVEFRRSGEQKFETLTINPF